ncbi:hypothetical protein XENOCAPTIV_030621 [Xenoophorus captivus]|uniref:Aryl hydrocarbon receptor nuclear translocator-like protein 1 n=1 Tax=Xenoophorus captivus TaxID=1517983 RepID=A0ABV0RG70_9TELE
MTSATWPSVIDKVSSENGPNNNPSGGGKQWKDELFVFSVLQMREKINTNCYKFKIKDGSFITLRSRWFSFMNPWTKEVEYIVSTNTVVSCPIMEGSDYPQSAGSPQSMDSVLTSDGKMLGKQKTFTTLKHILYCRLCHLIMVGHLSCRARGSFLDPILSATLTPTSDNSHLSIDIMDDPGSSSPSNDEAAMAVIMSLLEADAGLGGPVDFSDLPWPL